MSNPVVDISKVRHQIDTLTPTLPESMTRTEIATFAVAMQLYGMATALTVTASILAYNPAVMRASAAECKALGDALLD